MEEIKAGDFVAFDGHEGLWRVEHIMGEWCWIFKDAFSRSGQLAHIKRLTKEEKFFEAGKMYKNKYGKTFECVNVVKRNEKKHSIRIHLLERRRI